MTSYGVKEDKMQEGIRGLEAELPQGAPFRIIDVLRGISPDDNYKIFTPGCRVWSGFAPTSAPGLISPQDLRALSTPKYTIEELSLHFFPLDAQARELRDYADYMESACVCSIMYYDCGMLEIYTKDAEWLRRLKSNISDMHPVSLTYKTDLNDGRVSFI